MSESAAAGRTPSPGYFFVNPPQVRSLRRHVLPELLTRAGEAQRRLRIWSVDCAAGEEAYTVAMLIDEALRDPYGWDIEVLGTDADDGAVRQGVRAHYGLGSVVMVDPPDVRRWFRRDGEQYVVARQVRSRVRLRHCDVRGEPLPFAAREVDLMLWRCPEPDDTALLARLVDSLTPGGYLVLGPCEDPQRLTAVLPDDTLVALGDAWIYRRPEQTEDDRRATLPERRTADEGAPPLGLGRERRRGPRRVPSAGRARLSRGPSLTVDLTADAPGGPTVAPTEIAGLLRAARSALIRGEFLRAADSAAQACLVCPEQADGWYLRGVALVNAGRDAEAVEPLRSATECDPGGGFIWYVLGGALVRLGRSAEAAAAYRSAAASLGRPGDERAPELGGRTLAELVRQCRRRASELSEGKPQD